MKEIRSRVVKQELINWREMEWLQGKLKEITDKKLEKLIHSILTDDIIKAFHVWEHDGKIYCLDGNHLKIALEEIERRKLAKIPDKLKADFIDCRDRRQAGRSVLKYAATYTQIMEEGLFDFIQDFELDDDWNDIQLGLETPGFDLKRFTDGWFKEIDFDKSLLDDGDTKDEADLQLENTCPKCGYRW